MQAGTPSGADACAARQLAKQLVLPISSNDFDRFESTDGNFPGKGSIGAVRALDGATCAPDFVASRDGVLSAGGASCHDISAAEPLRSASGVGPDPFLHNWPMVWRPPAAAVRATRATPAATELAARLQAALRRNQFGASASGCRHVDEPTDERWRDHYYLHEVPMIGFGSVLEYAMMFLARAVHMGSQLVLGPRSSRTWTSDWYCGADRSLRCYFELSSCCGVVTMRGKELALPRRRNPLNLGLPGYNDYGGVWVSAQLAGFLFSTMNARTREALATRRATLVMGGGGGGQAGGGQAGGHAGGGGAAPLHLPRSAAAHVPTIGMHIRGGDACHAGRYCPSNLTATFFAEAAEMRRRYGANRLLLATDNAAAARLCREGVMGFTCLTMPMRRDKFDAAEFIEHRVAQHENGELSGSTVALDALADIDMLADCDFFVLVFRSAISRVAYALSLARKGHHVPLVSMHMPWSSKGIKIKGKPGARGRGGRARFGRGARFRGTARG